TMKKTPADLRTLEKGVEALRKLTGGDTVVIDGAEVRIPWSSQRVPVYVAAYGPKALKLAGRVGDGVILQIADAEVIKWSLEWVKKGAQEAGRSLDGFEVISAAAWCLGENIKHAREEVRWFPAMVSNHALDLMAKYPKEKLPPSLIKGMESRGSYDYWEHARKDAHHLGFVTEDMIDRFSIIGSVSDAVSRLKELEKVGVTTAVAYLLGDDFAEQTRRLTRELMPALTATTR
ncbi:MAG: LLM class flavin-dependent oxidoreductase, partial [Thermoprotei archaeon]